MDAAAWSIDGAMLAIGRGQQLQLIAAPNSQGQAATVLRVSCPEGELTPPLIAWLESSSAAAAADGAASPPAAADGDCGDYDNKHGHGDWRSWW